MEALSIFGWNVSHFGPDAAGMSRCWPDAALPEAPEAVVAFQNEVSF